MKSLDQVFDKALREAAQDAMMDLVGECDVCKWGISRAAMHIMDLYKPPGGFGCLDCVLRGRVPVWAKK